MFDVSDKVVYAMASIRFISSLLELSGALLMLYFGTAHKALQVNAGLALVGPFVLITVTALGVMGISGDIHWHRVLFILLGVFFILYGARG